MNNQKRAERKGIFFLLGIALCAFGLSKILTGVFGVHDEEEEYVLMMFSLFVVCAIAHFYFPHHKQEDLEGYLGVGACIAAALTGVVFLCMHFL